MFAPFEWLMAGRYLRARRQEGFVSVIAGFSLLGIALGVATLIIVMAVMNGFRNDLLDRILGLNGHILVRSVYGAVGDFEELARHVRALDHVRRVTPMIEGQVMATNNDAASGALVRGITAEDLAGFDTITEHLTGGSLAGLAEGDQVLIGSRLAGRLGLWVGDEVTLIAPEGTATAFGSVPRMRAYEIAGIFEIGMSEYDAALVFLPLEAAQIFFRMRGAVTGLEVVLDDPDRAIEMQPRIAAAVGPDLQIIPWQRMNATFFTALEVERNVMFLILTLIIVVAAFNIISSLIMLVKDKGRDIAILRTMGATRASVMRIFFITGAAIGVLGTTVGVVLGITFAANIETIRGWVETVTGTEVFSAEIYFLSQLPADIEPVEVVTVAVLALALSFLATLYPSWRAARLDPVEALRYE